MLVIREMLDTHPRPSVLAAEIAHCIEACSSCAAVCTVCADACLEEAEIASLVACIRLDLDCAAICTVTASVAARIGREDAQPLQAQLAACAAACRACGEACRIHATMHEHCRLCAGACFACADACEALMKAMRHAGESEAPGHNDQRRRTV